MDVERPRPEREPTHGRHHHRADSSHLRLPPRSRTHHARPREGSGFGLRLEGAQTLGPRGPSGGGGTGRGRARAREGEAAGAARGGGDRAAEAETVEGPRVRVLVGELVSRV